jgi:DMSO/TMAO reductase YedYZ heme-binding membrane subunit
MNSYAFIGIIAVMLMIGVFFTALSIMLDKKDYLQCQTKIES